MALMLKYVLKESANPMNTKKRLAQGFTIIELLVVITIIAVLAAITFVVYSGIQTRARDFSVLSDLDHMDAAQTSYGLKHKTAGKAYYSVNGTDSELGFTPSEGNVISVVVSSTDYCIRGYNANSTKNSIDNAAIKESSPGVCATIEPIYAPTLPVVAVTRSGSNVLATIATSNCVTGTAQYGIRYRINDGTWTDYTDWSATKTATQAATQGTKYGYQAQARCYSDDDLISDSSVGIESTYTSPVDAPTAPVIAAALNGANVQATVTTAPVCNASTVQYNFAVRLNDGTLGSPSAWSATPSATRTAVEGIKFGFVAQARCYLDADNSSSASANSNEPTYIHPITTVPATPTDLPEGYPAWNSTTYYFSSPSCPSGATLSYQYDFTTSYGYDSGWVPTSATSVNFTTSTFSQTYTLQLQAHCATAYSTGPWSGIGTGIYYRSIPTVQVLVVAGGGGGSKGGGGAGGYLYNSAYTVPTGSYSVTVGGLGAGAAGQGNNGGPSIFGTMYAYGGGGGGNAAATLGTYGSGGGGGGSDSHNNAQSYGTAGQGNNGGIAYTNGCAGSGGGGGAGGAGGAGGGSGGGGGSSVNNSITGTSVAYAGGGGGGANGGCSPAGGGGAGAGNGSGTSNGGGTNASIANVGSGGGGHSSGSGIGGNGSAGVVVISYPINSIYISTSGGSYTYTSGSNTIIIFTSNGTFTVN